MEKILKLNKLASAIDKRLTEMEQANLTKCPNEDEMVKWFNALPMQELRRVVSIGALYVSGFQVPDTFYEEEEVK